MIHGEASIRILHSKSEKGQRTCRQADQAYDEVERDRHYLQKQTVSHAGPDAELRAAQDHIRQLQRQLQLLERKCTGNCPHHYTSRGPSMQYLPFASTLPLSGEHGAREHDALERTVLDDDATGCHQITVVLRTGQLRMGCKNQLLPFATHGV